jgi:regulator of sigma E protease
VLIRRYQLKKWQWVLGSKEITEEMQDKNYEYGTLYSLNLLPLGGFVRIKGENSSDEKAVDSDSFFMKKFWQKAAVLCAGVGMNIVVAIILTTIGMLLGAPQDISNVKNVEDIKDRKILIYALTPGYPAEVAGIVPGDAIIKLDSLERPRLKELQEYVNTNREKQLAVTLERGTEIITIQIHPQVTAEGGKAVLGVNIAESGVYPWYKALYQGTLKTFESLWAIMVGFYDLIKNLVTGHGVGAGVSGPVGVAKLTGQVARMGFIYLLQFTALLSLNLAVLNILPIPALDGGRLLFVIIGKILGRPVTPKIEQWAHVIGFGLLMIIVILATGRDLNVVGWVQGILHR